MSWSMDVLTRQIICISIGNRSIRNNHQKYIFDDAITFFFEWEENNMDIVMFVIFLFTNLFMVGICAVVYSGKEKYQEGMILGVHIPNEHIENEQLQKICVSYKKRNKWWNISHFIIGVFLCFLCFYSFAIFMTIWILWLCIYIGGETLLVYVPHRKIYDLKIKNEWFQESTKEIVQNEEQFLSFSKKLPYSWKWQLPAIIAVFISFFLPEVQNYWGESIGSWIFPTIILLIQLVFMNFHIWIVTKKESIYSKNNERNLMINRMEKRNWTAILIASSWIHCIAWYYFVIRINKNRWLFEFDYGIYIGIQICFVLLFVFGVLAIVRTKKSMLSIEHPTHMIDDDEFWKNGWYNNPNDKRLFVQNRFCSTNYSLNLGRRAGKVIAAVTAVITIITIVGTIGMTWWFENPSITLKIKNDVVFVEGAMYHTEIPVEEIRSIRLLSNLPDDDFIKTNGGATQDYLIGHFTGKELGKCIFYYEKNTVPIIEIRTKKFVLYVNTKTKSDVEKWYFELRTIKE